MAYPNHLYRHELPPDVSSYIEMPTDIENYVKSRYGIDVHAEVTVGFSGVMSDIIGCGLTNAWSSHLHSFAANDGLSGRA